MQRSKAGIKAVGAATISAFAWAGSVAALPIGFGVNQGNLEYSEVKTDDFIVYYDARVPGEGRAALNALERVRPAMERWFAEKRTSPLPVVMSAVTANASFANFIADSVELQTLGLGGRDLTWHEYVHSMMYRKLDNWFGPAGALIHLPWMPAWFLEGLAESLSVSVGSDVMAGVERYQALTGDWPTYDRMHSLYSKYDFAERGYATSGALVSYLMRRGDPDKLPVMLDDFYRYSMPWWWPWAAVPFNGFMPMDDAFENFAGADGETLFAEYKTAAANHWRQAMTAPFLLKDQGNRWAFTSLAGLASDGKNMLHLSRADGPLKEVTLKFDPATGWATGFDAGREQPEDYDSLSRVNRPRVRAGVAYDETEMPTKSTLWIQSKAGKKTTERLIERSGTVYRLGDYGQGLVWYEHGVDLTKLCFELSPGKIDCPVHGETPRRIEPLGFRYADNDPGLVTHAIYSDSEEKLTGTVYRIGMLDPKARTKRSAVVTTELRPVAAAYAGSDLWVLAAERDRRTLRRYDDAGQCVGMLTFADHILDLHGLHDGSLVVSLYAGYRRYVRKLAPGRFKETACTPERGHSSPLLVAAKNPKATLKQAMVAADFWTLPTPSPAAMAALVAAPAADQDAPKGVDVKTSERAKWRGRPLFIFPWIGGDDALGPQLGIVSVPLMDNMQNETVRVTALYGVNSRFPYQEMALTSTRFAPTLNLALYRQQTYNGRFLDSDGVSIVNGYLDEKGARLESDYGGHALGGRTSFGLAVKYAHLKPYLGPYRVRRGFLAEPGLSLAIAHSLGDVSFFNQISARAAPEAMNEDFDYNQVGGSTSVSTALPLMSRLTLGLEGSRTRGKKRRELKEVYRPLKTFIPGSGGGYNQNSFPVTGDGSTGLFAPVFGDTQGRAKANWTVPLIADFDKWIWLVYLERLDFTAFYNYGGAWNGTEPRSGFDDLIRAHGYNLDLQLENKGVRFNLGAGAGQVIEEDFEVYLTTGFDALF